MRTKSKYTIWIVVVLVVLILGCTLFTGENTSKDTSPSLPVPKLDRPLKCVSRSVPDSLPLREINRQMGLAASSGKDLEYWIDGERTTPGCHWNLEHVECQKDGCLYRCRETEALWHLSWQKNSNLKMEKLGSSTLIQTYVFSPQPARGN